jgi:tRNA threonylcarbamoyladenosine biosynthesis protein TsaB
MLILAVNTATPALSAALWQDGRLLAEETLAGGQPHATTLLPAVEQLLAQTGLSVTAIEAMACAVGPGSYTGIRIGVSALKAMAYAGGKPMVGVSTLQALAWPWSGCAGLLVCPLIDARGGRAYAAAWFAGQPVIAEANWPIADFLERVAETAGTVHPAGILLVESPSGGTRAAATLAPEFQASVETARRDHPELAGLQIAPVACAQPRAAIIAEIAERQLAAGLCETAASLAPVYLSPSQAMRLAGTRTAKPDGTPAVAGQG